MFGIINPESKDFFFNTISIFYKVIIIKIWLDFCEPKSVTMLRPLYNRLIQQNHQVFITARDFDSTYALLDKWGVPYIKCGSYGGADLTAKLRSFTDRLQKLLDIVEREKPDFLFCITSPEAIRIAFGLKLPHVMFNDEPRSFGPSSLTLPFVEVVVVPKPIPIELYLNYAIKQEKIIRFNGIDEVGWLNQKDFKPDPKYLHELSLIPNEYIVCRTEPTQAYAHLKDRLPPYDSLLTQVIPKLLHWLNSEKKSMKFLVITRYPEQYEYLAKMFTKEIASKELLLFKGVAHLADLMYYSALVISGGGTMVRESALLGIPSIEFIPTDTYPQEQFLIDNGFPLMHLKKAEEIVAQTKKYLHGNFKQDTWVKIDALENPIEIGIQIFKKKMNISE